VICPFWKYLLLIAVVGTPACSKHPATYEGFWLQDAPAGQPRYLLSVDMERALRTQEVAMTGAAYQLGGEALVAAEAGDDGCAQLEGFECRLHWSNDGSGLYDHGADAMLLLYAETGKYQSWRFRWDLDGRKNFRVDGKYDPAGKVAGEAYVIKASFSGDEITVAEAGASGATGFAGTYRRLGDLQKRYAGIFR
jgi:hypothetical protein